MTCGCQRDSISWLSLRSTQFTAVSLTVRVRLCTRNWKREAAAGGIVEDGIFPHGEDACAQFLVCAHVHTVESCFNASLSHLVVRREEESKALLREGMQTKGRMRRREGGKQRQRVWPLPETCTELWAEAQKAVLEVCWRAFTNSCLLSPQKGKLYK